MPNLSTTGSLGKQRQRLVAAREQMDRTIAAMDTVIAYYSGMSGTKRIGRPPGIKNSKVGDEKTGVKKSTFTKPFRPKKIIKKTPKKKRFAKRKITAEGEARRRAGYFAYVERMKKQREQAQRKPAGKAQTIAA